MIYNPYFESVGRQRGGRAHGLQGRDPSPQVLRGLFALENIRGALITMPHKVSVVELLDEVTPTVQVAGACNAVRRAARRPPARATCSTARASCAASSARACGCTARARWWSAAAAWARAIAASLAGAGVAADRAVRRQRRAAEGAGRAGCARTTRPWPVRHRRQRSGRLRPGGQRHAAGHECGRPAAGGRVAARGRAPSSARW